MNGKFELEFVFLYNEKLFYGAILKNQFSDACIIAYREFLTISHNLLMPQYKLKAN